MDDRFLRIQMLLGSPAMERLAEVHVCVLGLGGVGSWCAEALARSGVGALTLMDQDTVDRSNLNRQAEALESTLGMPKAEAMAARVLDVNPHCRVRPIRGRYESASREAFFSIRYDYVVDAIDLVSCKLDLIETALARNLPIISALGTGNKLDASLLRVSDISKTEGCPLARVIRKELRARGIHHHKVVWSPEEARKPDQPEAPPPGRRSVPASGVWVPATAGLLLAGEVVMDLTGIRYKEKSRGSRRAVPPHVPVSRIADHTLLPSAVSVPHPRPRAAGRLAPYHCQSLVKRGHRHKNIPSLAN